MGTRLLRQTGLASYQLFDAEEKLFIPKPQFQCLQNGENSGANVTGLS